MTGEIDLDSVNLDADEWSSDISVVTSVLKLWLRELPNPLLSYELHDAFLEAARTCDPSDSFICPTYHAFTGNEHDRLRHIRLHERINELPDPNYATVKYFMGHLHKSVVPFSHLSYCRVMF